MKKPKKKSLRKLVAALRRKRQAQEVPSDLYDENAGYGGWGGPW